MTHQPAEAGPGAARIEGPRGVLLLARLMSGAPFALALAVLLLRSGYIGTPLYPGGNLLGSAVTALALGWAAIGVWIVWRARTPATAVLGVVLFTTPAFFGLLLGPALILILQNLS